MLASTWKEKNVRKVSRRAVAPGVPGHHFVLCAKRCGDGTMSDLHTRNGRRPLGGLITGSGIRLVVRVPKYWPGLRHSRGI